MTEHKTQLVSPVVLGAPSSGSVRSAARAECARRQSLLLCMLVRTGGESLKHNEMAKKKSPLVLKIRQACGHQGTGGETGK